MDNVIEIMDDLEMANVPSKTVYHYKSRKIVRARPWCYIKLELTRKKKVFCVDVSDEMSKTLKASGDGGVKDTSLYRRYVI